jgi:hypothetical protein
LRLTRDMLLKIAREHANERIRVSRRLVSICLTGALLGDDPILAGTADIDLVMVHDSEPIQAREIVRVNDDVHFDISHFSQSVFKQPRHLRVDPWLGAFLYNKPVVLHDSQHWFEFTQASSSAQFFHPDNVMQRAGSLLREARRKWTALYTTSDISQPQWVCQYLQIIENAGNAVACLTGMPLPERRFFINFPQKAQAAGRPDLGAAFIAMINSGDGTDAMWEQYKACFKAAYTAASSESDTPAQLHPARWAYYEKPISALWQSQPVASMWILLNIWTQAVSKLSEGAPGRAEWLDLCKVFNLDEENYEDRLENLDKILDMVEETMEDWGRENGAVDTVV